MRQGGRLLIACVAIAAIAVVAWLNFKPEPSDNQSPGDSPTDPMVEQRPEPDGQAPQPTVDEWCTEESAALWPNGLDAEQTLPDAEWDAWMERHEAFAGRCGSVGGNLPYIDLDGDGIGSTP